MDTKIEMTDRQTLARLGDRLARHRLNLNLTQAQLAREAGVAKRTVIRLENGESSQLANLIRVFRALGLLAHFDALGPAPLDSPIDQLKSRAKERKRASPAAKKLEPSETWAWGGDKHKNGKKS